MEGEKTHAEIEKKQLLQSKKKLVNLQKCFKCVICKSPVKLTAVISPCCNITLGCETCLQRWLSTSQHCPHCREPITLDK